MTRCLYDRGPGDERQGESARMEWCQESLLVYFPYAPKVTTNKTKNKARVRTGRGWLY